VAPDSGEGGGRVRPAVGVLFALVLAIMPWGAARAEYDYGLFLDVSGTATTLDGLVFRADPAPDRSVWVHFGVIGLTYWWPSVGVYAAVFALGFADESVEFASAIGRPGVDVLALTLSDTTVAILAQTNDMIDYCAEGNPCVPIYLGSVHLLYEGVPGDIRLIELAGAPSLQECAPYGGGPSLDCCRYSNVGLCKPPLPGDPACHINTPAEKGSWGTIKALYR
jgi:hypothetical protein